MKPVLSALCAILLLLLLSVSVPTTDGRILVSNPATLPIGNVVGDGFGTVTVCDNVFGVVGGNRYPVSLGSTNRINTFVKNEEDGSFGRKKFVTLNYGTATRSAYLPGSNLPLRVNNNQVFIKLQYGPDYDGFKLNSSIVHAFAANCSTLQQSGAAVWKYITPAAIATSFPANVRDSAGAAINNRYLTWAGGEMVSFEGNVTVHSGVVDAIAIVDSANVTVSSARLSVARSALAGVSVGASAWYAGGMKRAAPLTLYDKIDVIQSDLTIDSTTFTLSTPRSHLAGAAVGDIVVFAGGVEQYVEDNENGTIQARFSSRVDVYNSKTGQHWEYELSEARGLLAAFAAKDFIVFSGGATQQTFDEEWNLIHQVESSRIDYYHVPSNTWAVGVLTTPRVHHSGVGMGNVGYISPGASWNAATRTLEATSSLGNTLSFDYYSSSSSLAPSSIYSLLFSFLFA